MKYSTLLKIKIVIAAVLFGSTGFSQTSPLNIGTIPAGKSVVISYNVVVTGGTSVTNQAIISGNNIQTFGSNDPKTPAANDPTITTVLNVVPVTITTVKAYTKVVNSQTGVQVEWITENEINMKEYEVERSATGQQFTNIGNVVATNNASTSTYNFFDAQPVQGTNFYRIKSIDRSGTNKYSQVVKVNINKGNGTIVVYPNPVKDGQVMIGFDNLAKGVYRVQLFNQLGQKVFTTSVDHAGGSSMQSVLLKDVPSGNYQMQINDGKTKWLESVIIQ